MKNYEDYKLTPRQEKFVRLANDNGFVNKITRKDITILQAKYGIKKPAWLMKNTLFRYGRACYKSSQSFLFYIREKQPESC